VRSEDERSGDRAAGRLRQLRWLSFLELSGTDKTFEIPIERKLSSLLDSR